MAAPEVAIHRLATRVTAPEPEDAIAARGLVEQAIRRLGPGLDAALERAGLDSRGVLALPRIALRLRLQGEVDAQELGAAWAEALAYAILAALPQAASHHAAGGAETPAHFRDAWDAEAALLQALANGETLPWWAGEFVGPTHVPEAVAALLVAWVARDPARAAARMSALVVKEPAVAGMLDAAQARTLARRMIDAMRVASGGLLAIDATTSNGVVPQPDGALPPTLARLLAGLPAGLRTSLSDVPPELRAPWLVAAALKHAPWSAAMLPALLPRLAALPATTLRAPVVDASPAEALRPAPDSVEVWCGGLLLLIRPLARLRPGWLALDEGLPIRLLTLGLLALRRLAAPLPAAGRRAALERDRALLAIFAGTEPPDTPLDEAPLHATPEAEDALAAVLAALPDGVAHAPGALRRAYGRDPFAADSGTDRLCRLLLRPGRLLREEGAATLVWPLESADAALRRAGWDVDLGWVPWLGRRITFRYGAS